MHTAQVEARFWLAIGALVLSLGPVADSRPAEPPKVDLVRIPDGGLQPQAAVDPAGVLHLVYFKGEPRGGDIFYVRQEPGQESLSTPLQVNSQPHTAMAIGTIRGAHMALGKGNRIHVAWMSASSQDKGMFYTRLNDSGTAFEPQRNVVQFADHLDGGGSIAADLSGHVYVAWHAGLHEDGEVKRRIWMARSTDGGRTFAREQRANPTETGACGCCGMRAGADNQGNVYMMYRAATELVHRDMYLLMSGDGGASFQDTLVHAWEVSSCPMSSASITAANGGVLNAWETAGQVYYTQTRPDPLSLSGPVPAPGSTEEGRKHPAVAGNGLGRNSTGLG